MASSSRAVRFDVTSDTREFVYPTVRDPEYGKGAESSGDGDKTGPVKLLDEADLVDKQRLLLKFLMTFKAEQTHKEIDLRLNSCKIVLELLEQEKLLLTHLMRTLNDQKSLADIFTREENQIEELKYCDKFPENNKLAIAFLEFFLTELYSVRAQKTRSRVLHSLVRESRYLSNQFQGAPKLEMKGNEGRLFLLLKDVSSWDEVTVKSSESVNLWNCSWSLSAQLVKTQKLRIRALSAFRPGIGCHVSLTLFCKPPRINNHFRYCSTTLKITFSLLNRHEPGKNLVKNLSTDFEGSKMAHWEVEEFASWETLKTSLDVWAKNDSFLFECSFKLNEV